jgi:hypothetical protein
MSNTLTPQPARAFLLSKTIPKVNGWYPAELLEPALNELLEEAERLQAEKAEAVKDAVADVLRQIRQPLLKTLLGPFDDGQQLERKMMNEAADALAKRYGVDLGEWPTFSASF